MRLGWPAGKPELAVKAVRILEVAVGLVAQFCPETRVVFPLRPGRGRGECAVRHATPSGDLRKFIEGGKKIIIGTVQKFPFISDEIGDERRTFNFAIIIDEAHSSQGGKTSAALNEALADPEDEINDALEQRIAARKLLENAGYFAFTG